MTKYEFSHNPSKEKEYFLQAKMKNKTFKVIAFFQGIKYLGIFMKAKILF
jgi:hypothetical protein